MEGFDAERTHGKESALVPLRFGTVTMLDSADSAGRKPQIQRDENPDWYRSGPCAIDLWLAGPSEWPSSRILSFYTRLLHKNCSVAEQFLAPDHPKPVTPFLFLISAFAYKP